MKLDEAMSVLRIHQCHLNHSCLNHVHLWGTRTRKHGRQNVYYPSYLLALSTVLLLSFGPFNTGSCKITVHEPVKASEKATDCSSISLRAVTAFTVVFDPSDRLFWTTNEMMYFLYKTSFWMTMNELLKWNGRSKGQNKVVIIQDKN